MGICTGEAPIATRSILHPSGKNCPITGGFRFVLSDHRPDPVFDCCQHRELRFVFKTTG